MSASSLLEVDHQNRLRLSDGGYLLKLFYIESFLLFNDTQVANDSVLSPREHLRLAIVSQLRLPADTTEVNMVAENEWQAIAASPQLQPFLVANVGNNTKSCLFGAVWLVKNVGRLFVLEQPRSTIVRKRRFDSSGDLRSLPLPTLPSEQRLKLAVQQQSFTNNQCMTNQTSRTRSGANVPNVSIIGNFNNLLIGTAVYRSSTSSASLLLPRAMDDATRNAFDIRCNCTDCDAYPDNCNCRKFKNAASGLPHPLPCGTMCHNGGMKRGARGGDSCRALTPDGQAALKLLFQHDPHWKLAEQLVSSSSSSSLSIAYGRHIGLDIAFVRMFCTLANVDKGIFLSERARVALALPETNSEQRTTLDAFVSMYIDATSAYNGTHLMAFSFLPGGGLFENAGSLQDRLLTALRTPYVTGIFNLKDTIEEALFIGSDVVRAQLQQLAKHTLHVGGRLYLRIHVALVRGDLQAIRKFLNFACGGNYKCANCTLLFCTNSGLNASNTQIKQSAVDTYALLKSWFYHHHGNPPATQVAHILGPVVGATTSVASTVQVNDAMAVGNGTNAQALVYPGHLPRTVTAKCLADVGTLQHNDVGVAGFAGFIDSTKTLVEHAILPTCDIGADTLHMSGIVGDLHPALERSMNRATFWKNVVNYKFVGGTNNIGKKPNFGGLPFNTRRAIYIACDQTLIPALVPSLTNYAAVVATLRRLAELLYLSSIAKPTKQEQFKFASSAFLFHQLCAEMFPEVLNGLYYHNYITHMVSQYFDVRYGGVSLLSLSRTDETESIIARMKDHLMSGSRHVQVAMKNTVR